MQFVDMFEIVDVSPVVLVLEGDERADNTFPFFSGDLVEFLFFQVILSSGASTGRRWGHRWCR